MKYWQKDCFSIPTFTILNDFFNTKTVDVKTKYFCQHFEDLYEKNV